MVLYFSVRFKINAYGMLIYIRIVFINVAPDESWKNCLSANLNVHACIQSTDAYVRVIVISLTGRWMDPAMSKTNCANPIRPVNGINCIRAVLLVAAVGAAGERPR